jgi:hypothetical protein
MQPESAETARNAHGARLAFEPFFLLLNRAAGDCTYTTAAKVGLDHLLFGEKGELGARKAKLTTQDLDVVLAHERCTA